MSPIIVIAGPTGSGKTTLSRSLSLQSGYMLFEERFEDNPYLAESTINQTKNYENILWFIGSDYERYRRACDYDEKGVGVVIDKPFFEELTYITLAGFSPEQTAKCRNFVLKLMEGIKKPDLVIDLQVESPELSRRISTRGREFEKSIQETWLEKFKRVHEQEFRRLPELRRLLLDAHSYDFRNETHVNLIYNKIINELAM